MTGDRGRARRGPRQPWWPELPLVLVDLTVAVGFCRVFRGWSFLLPLVAFVVLGHASAIAARRLLPGPVGPVVAVVGGALAATWILFPSTTWLGLPTSATWDAAGRALSTARAAYPVVVAPTADLRGFLLAAGLALWVAAWFGDWTSRRLHATAEAVATSTAIFVFCAVLGSGRYQVASAAGFALAVLLFAATQRATSIEREQSWQPTARATARAVLGAGVAVAVLAVAAGALVGPRLPGAGDPATVRWRGRGGGDTSRVTVSPMVELKRRLVQQSDAVVFRVRATQRSYWRLTSLDRFDGRIWSSSGQYRPADDRLEGVDADQPGDPVTQTFRIDALATLWAPAAFEATSVRRTSQPLRWDARSGTLIVAAGRPTTDGMTYTVVSRSPTFDPTVLRAADGRDAPSLARYEGLPASFPEPVAAMARQVTDGAGSRYDAALALQEWFRNEFTYSLDVPAGHGDDALLYFLQTRVGYCEQFAGAYAAMARSLGMPARVAVGFTPGNQSSEDPATYTVRGRHAHAWPEVWFPGVGWVPFEPTPGRGIPGGERYTGVAEAQDESQPVRITTTTAAPERTTTTTPSSGPTTEPERTRSVSTDPAVQRTDEGGGRDRRPLLALLAIGAAAVAMAVARARRRGRRATTGRGPVERRWQEVLARLEAQRHLAPAPGETPVAFAERATAECPDLGPALEDLAAVVTEARWSAEGTTDALVAAADDLARDLLSEPVPA
ncbi:MAG: DUF3488 and transglutaminase-like domain-containing protein [Acidimicrobiales bacterium]